jgi:FeS assembly SUF system regulator
MIKVTRLADYAVSIIYAFSGSEKEILSSQDIVEKTKLHKATVNKLLAQLVKKNVLEPFRGTKGGYRLKKGLDNISIRELIEAIEGPVLLTDCLNKNANNCNLFNVCNTKNIWSFINTEINNTLENIKIKDIKGKKFNY